MKLLNLILASGRKVTAANDLEELAANEAISAGAFTFTQTDGFVIPYGVHPHPVGDQIFDKAAAQAMANELASLTGKAKRLFTSVPVYAGHPDHPDLKKRVEYPDRRARGCIKEIIVGENEAKFVVAYNKLGQEEVGDSQWLAVSPLWEMVPAPNESTGSRKAYRPARLRSMALTNNPNMDLPPISVANEDGKTENKNAANEALSGIMATIKASLVEAGLAKAEDDDDAIAAAIGSLIQSLAWSRQREKEEKAEAERKMEVLAKLADNEAADFDTAVKAIADKLTAAAANESAANTLAGLLAEKVLDAKITEGAITPPDRDKHKTALMAAANEVDFTVAFEAMKPAKDAAPPAEAKSLAGAKADVLAANDKESRTALRNAAVNEAMKQHKCSWDSGWQIARKANPDLFSH